MTHGSYSSREDTYLLNLIPMAVFDGYVMTVGLFWTRTVVIMNLVNMFCKPCI